MSEFDSSIRFPDEMSRLLSSALKPKDLNNIESHFEYYNYGEIYLFTKVKSMGNIFH